jgi:hypothetical protein
MCNRVNTTNIDFHKRGEGEDIDVFPSRKRGAYI